MPHNNKPIVYFRHRELVALVEHPARRSGDVIDFLANDSMLGGDDRLHFDALYRYRENDKLREFFDEHQIDIEAIHEQGFAVDFSLEHIKITTLPDERADPNKIVHSMVTIPVEYPNADLDAELVANEVQAEDLNKLDREVSDSFCQSLEKDDAILLYLAGELNNRIIIEAQNDQQHESPPSEPGRLVLKAVSPDWLLGGGQSQISTGGPGSKPVPPTVSTNTAAQLKFDVSNEGLHEQRGLMPKKYENFKKFKDKYENPDAVNAVDVFILDTAPSLENLEKNVGDWHGPDSLFEQLFDVQSIPGGRVITCKDKFKIHLYPRRDQIEFKDLGLKDHDYDMVDHGLFIASIIRKLTPNANIHLIQVLNDHCAGTMDALRWGIMEVSRLANNRDLSSSSIKVANSSLMLCFPFDESQTAPAERAPVVQLWLTIARHKREDITTILIKEVKQLYDLLKVSTTVFAAAGNDGNKTANGQDSNDASADMSTQPVTQYNQLAEARYPAAFDGVYGVGARDGSYSNKADAQQDERFMAFGGNANDLAVKGILGLYTRKYFPDGTINESGLARWAGTSFATAVATGTFARLAQHGCDDCQAKNTMIDAVKEANEPLPDKGHILPVKQG